MSSVLHCAPYLALLVLLAVPLGGYIKKVMDGERCALSRVFDPCERALFRLLRIDPGENMGWKRYLASVLAFSLAGLIAVAALQMLQAWLPGNPQGAPNVAWDLAFNTAASFVTNTNWQAYSGEAALGNLVQALGLTVQNFASAATGIAVLFALIRGMRATSGGGLGSFWADLVRIVMRVLIPLNLTLAVCLAGAGVVQSLQGHTTVQLLEPIAVAADGTAIEGARIDADGKTVTLDGEVVEDARVVTEQHVPLGPAASQVAIKQSGTNGGGFMGTNSAHPLENPNAFSNLLETLALLLIPVALCFTFGKAVGNRKQGLAIFAAMLLLLCVALASIALSEQAATPQLAQDGAVNVTAVDDGGMLDQAGGNMEGKESRFGIAASSTWAAFTTAASNGSVNAMLDSFTPLGGLVPLLQMQLGEVVFGGVGSGLYGMLGFAVLAVFVAGLMVGRTPEFLGKKIEPREMRCAVIACLATPIAALAGAGVAVLVPGIADTLTNTGAHGFSELLYAYSSCAANNGSAFAGLGADTVFLNVSLGLVMLFARFVPIAAVLALAGSLAGKERVAATAGTLSTTGPLFVLLLVFVVLLVGALSFVPALALGPVAEFVGMTA